MNGLDILNYISKDDRLLSRFGGLFAIDPLHFQLHQQDIFYICYTDIAKTWRKTLDRDLFSQIWHDDRVF